jgi:hypothetical protein
MCTLVRVGLVEMTNYVRGTDSRLACQEIPQFLHVRNRNIPDRDRVRVPLNLFLTSLNFYAMFIKGVFYCYPRVYARSSKCSPQYKLLQQVFLYTYVIDAL